MAAAHHPVPRWVGFYSNTRAVPTPAGFPLPRIVKGAEHREGPSGRQCRFTAFSAIVLDGAGTQPSTLFLNNLSNEIRFLPAVSPPSLLPAGRAARRGRRRGGK